jgi:hypothetical protein
MAPPINAAKAMHRLEEVRGGVTLIEQIAETLSTVRAQLISNILDFGVLDQTVLDSINIQPSEVRDFLDQFQSFLDQTENIRARLST